VRALHDRLKLLWRMRLAGGIRASSSRRVFVSLQSRIARHRKRPPQNCLQEKGEKAALLKNGRIRETGRINFTISYRA